MCGIFAYLGMPVSVGSVALSALRSMEYRGYDSWGVAYTDRNGAGHLIKRVGRVDVDAAGPAEARAVIGHTRWATHGAVSVQNAHPQLGWDQRFAVVHNGIIENASALRADLRGISFGSETDTELIAHLVTRHIEQGTLLPTALQLALASINGANAFAVLDRVTGEVAAISRRLPIVVGESDSGTFLVSDPVALAGLAVDAYALADEQVVTLGTPEVPARTRRQPGSSSRKITIPKAREHGNRAPGESMRTEIEEQPSILRRIAADATAVDETARIVAGARRVLLTGCGSAYHAAMYTAELISQEGRTDARALPASEAAESAARIGEVDVLIAFTQSGETADVIDAVLIGKERGVRTVAFVNAEGSSVERLTDAVTYLHAGHERSVLATKSYTAMLARGYQLAESLRTGRTQQETERLLYEAVSMEAISQDPHIERWARELSRALAASSSSLIVATGRNTPAAREAALKIKEGGYVHAESVLAGELKHGVIALVEDGFPCIMLASESAGQTRLGIATEELVSRGANVFWVGRDAPDQLVRQRCDRIAMATSPFTQAMLMQLVALETAKLRGIDPDFPRNLAKSVTVR